MKCFFIVIFTIAYPLCSFSQDYQQYLTLSYAEIDSLEYIANQQGDINQSILYLQAGREKASNEFGDRDTLIARYLDLLASYYYVLEDLDQASSLFTQAYEIREEKLGKEHPDFATSSAYLGNLLVKLGKFDEALPLLIQSKDIREKALGKKHPEYAMSLYFLGVYYENRGDFNSLMVLDPSEDAEKAFHIADKNKSVLLLQAMKSEKTNRFGELPDSLAVRDECTTLEASYKLNFLKTGLKMKKIALGMNSIASIRILKILPI